MQSVEILKTLIFFGFCGVVAFSDSQATTVRPMNTGELLRASTFIAYVRIEAMETHPRTGARAVRAAVLDLARAPASRRDLATLRVQLFNRLVSGNGRDGTAVIERVPLAPELRVGEEYLLFLEEIPAGRQGIWSRSDGIPLFALRGLHQGQMRVLLDARRVRRAAAWHESASVPVSDAELSGQSPSARKSPVPDAAKIAALPSLDSLLNEARKARAGP